MNLSLEVYDIETLKPLFLYCGLDIQTGNRVAFRLDEWIDELDSLCKHLEKDYYWVSYNGISYDSQVLQFILDNNQYWINLSNKEILAIIYKFSQKVIETSKYELQPIYKEDYLDVKQIDLFKIHHFDNKARRCSLKWLQFAMNYKSVEEMPYKHDTEYFTPEQIQEIISYCWNDVESTYELYLYTIGAVNHPDYGTNMIQDRLDVIGEFKFSIKALSWSNVKIGDEINKKVYMGLSGLNERQIMDLKFQRGVTKRFTFADCIPKYVKFKTPEFQRFHELVKDKVVKMNSDGKKNKKTGNFFPFHYNGTYYMIAQGGIHSREKNRIVVPTDNEILMDADVGSQYPHFIIKQGLYPSHLGRAWLAGYTQTRDKRLVIKDKLKDYKEGSEEYRKQKGLAEMYKLALNGGGFGKTKENTNWQYDPFVTFSCTIGNQFEILMLIEMLEISGIHVISANTDGVVCLFSKDKLDLYYTKCHEWETIVGNTVQGKLEFAEYSKLVQLSVNGYLAIKKKDGTVKKKKEFLTEHELHKNKSARILALAMEQYFVSGTEPDEFIKNHKSIFDFCIGSKVSKDYHYEGVTREGDTNMYERTIRHYICSDGERMLKIKNEDSEATGNDVSRVTAGIWKSKVVNDIDSSQPIESYNIDYRFYIQKTSERIAQLERGKKKGKVIIKNKAQGSLF